MYNHNLKLLPTFSISFYPKEGRINYAQSSRHEYNLTDHLGNTRVCFTPNPANPTDIQPKILQQTNYYAYGLPIGNLSKTYPLITGGAYPLEQKYQYNGIELTNDFGLMINEARYRTLDPQLGRWWQIDPEVEQFEAWSAYNSNLDNPISNADPDGDAPWLVVAGIVWAVYEVGSQIYDTYDAYKTVTNPKASTAEKVVAVTGVMVDVVAPGGGYGQVAKKGLGQTVKATNKAAETVKANKKAGDAREVVRKTELQAQHPDSKVHTQRYIRDKDGKIVKDPVTGEGRKLDFVVEKDGKGHYVEETTSKTARKKEQTAKENRIREAGGTNFRESKTKRPIDISNTQTTIHRMD